MKRFILFFVGLCLNIQVPGQVWEPQLSKIGTINERIYKADIGIDVFPEKSNLTKNEIKKAVEITQSKKQYAIDSISAKQDTDTIMWWNHPRPRVVPVIELVRKELVPELGLDLNQYDKDKFIKCLDYITHTETITWLEWEINRMAEEAEQQVKDHKTPVNYPEAFDEILSLVHHRIDQIMEQEFSFYRFTETSRKLLKYVYVDHSNDFLSIHNDDRDYTGGFRFEVATDWLKLRFLGSFSDRPFNPNSRNWYSYQSIFVGGEGYTPYIRDTTIFTTPTSYDPDDRPFASFKYWGRAKYRISRHGHIRILSELKLGSIGSSAPKVIQSAMHRDINPGALTPNGWDSQIAAGGRFAFSYHVAHEFMLISKGWLWNKKATRNNAYFNKGSEAFNLSLFDEIKIGHEMTSLGIGLNFSNRNFKQTGALGIPFLKPVQTNKWHNVLTANTFINVRAQYRYIVHNSMLEGYGIIKHVVDEDPTSPIDLYYLRNDQMNRNIFLTEISLNFRLKYCGLIFKQTIMSPEFDLPVNNKTYSFAANQMPGRHNTNAWNHVGTIGVIFRVL